MAENCGSMLTYYDFVGLAAEPDAVADAEGDRCASTVPDRDVQGSTPSLAQTSADSLCYAYAGVLRDRLHTGLGWRVPTHSPALGILFCAPSALGVGKVLTAIKED